MEELLGDGAPSDTVQAEASAAELKAAEQAADGMMEMQPQYTEEELHQIASSQSTDMAKEYNGSAANITKDGKLEQMAEEYKQAAKDLALQKDISRIRGNNASAQYALQNNAKLKEREEKIYLMRKNITE